MTIRYPLFSSSVKSRDSIYESPCQYFYSAALVVTLALMLLILTTNVGAVELYGRDASTDTQKSLLSFSSTVDQEAIRQYTQRHNISWVEGEQALRMESDLTLWATGLRSNPTYAGFKIERDAHGVRGVLATTSTKVDKSITKGLPVRQVAAALSESEARRLSDRMLKEGHSITYDPFSNSLTAWVSEQQGNNGYASDLVSDHSITEGLRAKIRSVDITGKVSALPIHIADSRNISLMFGGLKLESTNGLCTSGFGVTKWYNGRLLHGYITAGHCRAVIRGDFIVEWEDYWCPKCDRESTRFPVRTYWDTKLGGYVDRTVMEAGGSHWLVHTGDFSPSDFNSNTVHLFKGAWYCSYGRVTNRVMCDNIFADNVEAKPESPNTGAVIATFWYWEAGGDVRCQGGDSGGPVWKPGNGGTPAGLIEAADDDTGQCFYLSLDDNLNGWSLK